MQIKIVKLWFKTVSVLDWMEVGYYNLHIVQLWTKQLRTGIQYQRAISIVVPNVNWHNKFEFGKATINQRYHFDPHVIIITRH